jgi:hypothetical protein
MLSRLILAAWKMRAAYFLLLFSLGISISLHADSSTDAKRDEAQKEIQACLRRNEVSSRLCKNLNKNVAILVDIYQGGDKSVLPTLLRFTYLTEFYDEALISDPEAFLTTVSHLPEKDRMAVVEGIAGLDGVATRERFEAVRTTLMRVPDSSANHQLAQNSLLTFDTRNAFFLVNYFPPDTFTSPSGSFDTRWFSRELYALQEKALWPPSSANERTYRLTVFPAFTFPRSVTLTVMPDGTGQVRFRETDASRYHLNVDTAHTTTAQQATDFTNSLDRIQFWQLPTHVQQLGFDGAEFVLEAVQDGRYHVVIRWCPGKTPFGKTVQDLFHLADTKFSGC